MTKRTTKRRAYSYIRFSTPEQEKGDSLRRQREWRDQFVKNNGYELDTSLTLLDKGRSAFKGDHKNKGALRTFLDAVENGTVPSGSILLVESIDRLTRLEPIDAIEMICFGLFRHGITVQTTVAEYSPDSGNDGRIYGLIAEIQRAYSESKRKSELITASRDEARKAAQENGTKITSRGPAWLKPVKHEGKIDFKIIPEAQEAIKKIFKWKLEGVGVERIAKRLNEENGWQRPNGWQSSYVKKIISNRAVIGEYQPKKKNKKTEKREPEGEPIEGYYPQIIDRDLFYKVQELRQKNKGTGGRKDRCSNILTYIVKCAYCGGKMRFVDKGDPQKLQRYLVCDYGNRKVKCKYYSIRYDETEKLILENCFRLKPEHILPNPDEHAEHCKKLRQKVDGKKAEIEDIESQLENLTARVGYAKSENAVKRIFNQIELQENLQAKLKKSVKELESELTNVEQAGKSIQSWANGIKELQKAIAKKDAVDERRKLRLHLEELITKVEIFANGYLTSEIPEKPTRATSKIVGNRLKYVPAPPRQIDEFYESIEAEISEFAPDTWRDDMFQDFISYIAEQRKTKKGRFIRVFFKTGAVVDLVPKDSLASGVEMKKDNRKKVGWRFVSPPIDRMWRDYQTEYNKKNCKAKKARK